MRVSKAVTLMGFYWLQDQCSFQQRGSFLTEAEVSAPALPKELGNYQMFVSFKKRPHTNYLTRDHTRLKLRF